MDVIKYFCLSVVSRMVRSVSPTDLAQKAFVRGLSDDADEDTLRRTFSKFGEVVEGMHAMDMLSYYNYFCTELQNMYILRN